jgi:hypothetical protein
MDMKKRSRQYSFNRLVCSAVAYCVVGAGVMAWAGDPVSPEPAEKPTAVVGAVSNSLRQPIVWTNHLSLKAEPTDRYRIEYSLKYYESPPGGLGDQTTWAAGYLTNSLADERAWTNRVSLGAQSGDAEAQVSLAICLHDGRHGFPTNTIQAYKWAVIAASQGQSARAQFVARRLLNDWRTGMSTNDVAAGEAAAAEALSARGKKKQE